MKNPSVRKGAYFLHQIRRQIDKRPQISPLEYATVLSADPPVIQLDSGDGLTLEYDHGDFVMPDYLILEPADHLLVEPIGKGHQYAVHYRLRGKLDEAVLGTSINAKFVAHAGIPTGPASAGTAHTHDQAGSLKVKVD